MSRPIWLKCAVSRSRHFTSHISNMCNFASLHLLVPRGTQSVFLSKNRHLRFHVVEMSSLKCLQLVVAKSVFWAKKSRLQKPYTRVKKCYFAFYVVNTLHLCSSNKNGSNVQSQGVDISRPRSLTCAISLLCIL